MADKKGKRRGQKKGRSQSKGGDRREIERERKDHVLQARVPESLHRDLIEQARRLRVPVSNLVRNILEDSFRMVTNLVDSGLDIAEILSGGVDEKELSSVLGWQPMTANRRLPCARCGKEIEKGSEAFTSVVEPGKRAFVICGKCKCEL